MNEFDSYMPKIEPYHASMEGWNPYPDDPAPVDICDWPNTVSISVVTVCGAPTLDDNDYADAGEQRELVEIDTNYKDTRPGEYPVRLTRTAAIDLTDHVLKAAEDTFHYGRVGRLRATEAAQLLQTIERMQATLQNVREHALQDLLHDTGIEE